MCKGGSLSLLLSWCTKKPAQSRAGYSSANIDANIYCGFFDLKFSIGIKGIDMELIGVPLRFFISTPRSVPIVATIKVSKINGSCVVTFPFLSNEMILFIGDSPNDIDIAFVASIVSVEVSTIFTFALTTILSSSIIGFISWPICILIISRLNES